MKVRFDLKSFVAGVLVAIFIMLTAPRLFPTGRYKVMGFDPDHLDGVYVLDTHTQELWLRRFQQKPVYLGTYQHLEKDVLIYEDAELSPTERRVNRTVRELMLKAGIREIEMRPVPGP